MCQAATCGPSYTMLTPCQRRNQHDEVELKNSHGAATAMVIKAANAAPSAAPVLSPKDANVVLTHLEWHAHVLLPKNVFNAM